MLPKHLAELSIGVYLKKNLINRDTPITIIRLRVRWYGSQPCVFDGAISYLMVFQVRMVLRKEEFFLRGFLMYNIDDLNIALSNSSILGWCITGLR